MVTPDRSDGALPHFPGWITLEKLGEGGMCAVYRCRPESGDGPERAVKMLTDKAEASVRRFNDEARLIQRIDHPNVVKVHQLVTEPRPPWLVMDLLGGRDLEGTMQIEGPMDPERCARVFADLASGLAAVHAQGVRHRDLKPANVRLGADGVPRLIDFGIARDANAARVTKAGFVVGTASYLPPEIFVEEDSGAVQDTEAADVYALGQTMCEVLAGKPVHGGSDKGTEASILVRIMRDKLDREHLDPRDFGARVPEALAQIVRLATAREPDSRIKTARDLEQSLRGFLATRVSSAALAPVTRMGSDSGAVHLVPPAFTAPTTTPQGAARAEAAPPPPRPSLPPPLSPAPPQEAPARRDPAPAEASSSRATTAVAATAAVAGVGAMGVAGITIVVVGVLVALGLVGVGAWVWQQRTTEEVVAADARRLRHALGECRGPRAPDALQVHLVVDGGRTRSVDVVDDAPERVSRCVEDVFRKAVWSTEAHVELEVPVDFR
jgi:serine/threonine protein kinase